MVEGAINKDKLEVPTENLRNVVTIDYFATHKLLRELYVMNFDKHEFQIGILRTYEWLGSQRQNNWIFNNKNRGDMPEFVRPFYLTFKLHQELLEEVNNQPDLLFFKPVAFALGSKGLIEDLKHEVNCPPEILLRPHLSFQDQDEPFSKLFRQYWGALKERANFLVK